MKYREEKGSLFELDNNKYIFAHCISVDCEMGKGIAVEFRNRYKGIQSYCKRVVSENHLSHPCVISFYNNTNLVVFNLITKTKYYNKPTYKTIKKAIQDMADLCKQGNIKYLAMPKIGYGLDGLQWGKVRDIIIKEFQDLDIEIVVRYL